MDNKTNFSNKKDIKKEINQTILNFQIIILIILLVLTIIGASLIQTKDHDIEALEIEKQDLIERVEEQDTLLERNRSYINFLESKNKMLEDKEKLEEDIKDNKEDSK